MNRGILIVIFLAIIVAGSPYAARMVNGQGFDLKALFSSIAGSRAPQPVHVLRVTHGSLEEHLSANGRVVANKKVVIRPVISGRLQSVHVEVGDNVSVGQILAQLDRRESESRVRNSEIEIKNAQREIRRLKARLEELRTLFELGGESRRALEDIEIEIQDAKTRLHKSTEALFQERLRLESTVITTPIKGIVTTSTMNLGQWVSQGDSLMEIADFDSLEIEAQVDASDIDLLQPSQAATIRGQFEDARRWRGKVDRISPAIDPANQANTVSVFITPLDAENIGLRIGEEVTVKITTSVKQNVTKVPYAALYSRDGKEWVDTVTDGRIQHIQVTTGGEDNQYIEIVKGLPDSVATLVVDARRLADGTPVVVVDQPQ